MNAPVVEELYTAVLARGEAATQRYYAALRARGIEPLPDPARGVRDLYAPNPVLVEGAIVDGMVVDANTFRDALRRREFYAIQALTGGPERGMRIVDPREIASRDGRAHSRRDGRWIPVRRVYSRLVYTDMLRLFEAATADERRAMRALFGSAEISWINHPLHFFYGSKADFPTFWRKQLSSALPECYSVTDELIRERLARLGPDARAAGMIQKPVDLQGGRAVIRSPSNAELRPGAILQREIEAAACHRTLWGDRTPEVRVMCLPNEAGRLAGGLLFTRVKAPDVFLSNAGHTARLNIPGTGEGYGVAIWE